MVLRIHGRLGDREWNRMSFIPRDRGHPGESMRDVNRDICICGKITISPYGRTMQGGNILQGYLIIRSSLMLLE